MLIRTVAAALTVIACGSFAMPADAAPRDRVFVASYGTDTNNTICSFTQPCRTFANAILNVAAGGEITAIDSAGFGPVTINQAVTITSPNGVEAGITATAGGNAVTIQAGINEAVSLHGVTLEGAGVGGYGVNVLSGQHVDIVNCTIRDFVNVGINSATSNSHTIQLTVADTRLSNNGYGVYVLPSGAGPIIASFDHVFVNDNQFGMTLAAGGAGVNAMITNSEFTNNITTGLAIGGQTNANMFTAVHLVNTVFNNHATAVSLGSFSTLSLSQINDTSSNASIHFISNTSVTAFSDGTNHVGVSGGSLSAYPLN